MPPSVVDLHTLPMPVLGWRREPAEPPQLDRGELAPGNVRFAMAVNSATELGAALAQYEFDRIVGTREANWIDFKSAPYSRESSGGGRLTQSGRFELCKDVAAFANLSGGCIVIGFQTERDVNVEIEFASSFSLIDNSHASISSYRSAIQNGIYPPIRDPRIEWFNPSESSEGILLIEVNPQPTDQQPFLLRRLVDNDGQTIEATSIPMRNGDRTDWSTAERIHAEIRTGRAGPSYANAIANNPTFESAEQVQEEIEGQQNWQSAPVFWLQARPNGPLGHIQHFFGPGGLASKLQNFPPLRANGFNLTVFGMPDYSEGNVVYGSREEAYLRLDSTGILSLAILASPRVIGWGVRQDPSLEFADPVIVNGTVVIEETVELCRFMHSVLRPELPNVDWTFRLTCKNFKNHGVRLGPGAPRLYMQLALSSTFRSSSDLWVRQVPLGESVARDSFDIMTNFYALFNLGPDSIPYSNADGIDMDVFLTMTD
jgi:hypothetical protein